jgi:hypothetical protein
VVEIDAPPFLIFDPLPCEHKQQPPSGRSPKGGGRLLQEGCDEHVATAAPQEILERQLGVNLHCGLSAHDRQRMASLREETRLLLTEALVERLSKDRTEVTDDVRLGCWKPRVLSCSLVEGGRLLKGMLGTLRYHRDAEEGLFGTRLPASSDNGVTLARVTVGSAVWSAGTSLGSRSSVTLRSSMSRAASLGR